MAGRKQKKYKKDKRKNFIREKKIYCGKEWLEVDIVPVTNMPEAGKKNRHYLPETEEILMTKGAKGVLYRQRIPTLGMVITIFP